MKFIENIFDLPIIVFSFSRHFIFKNKVLSLIESSPSTSLKDSRQSISRTDWNVSSPNKNYFSLIRQELLFELSKTFQKFQIDEQFEIGVPWFQQYENIEFHSWHNHLNCFLSVVYYVELDIGSQPTKFRGIFNKKEFTPDVTEGDVIIFPGILDHCSPCNNSNKRKTVIVFNLTKK